MDREELINKLSDFLREALMKKNLQIKPEDNLANDLGLDSMGGVEFVTNVEDEYQISINEDEIQEINTLNDAVDLVLRKLSQKV